MINKIYLNAIKLFFFFVMFYAVYIQQFISFPIPKLTTFIGLIMVFFSFLYIWNNCDTIKASHLFTAESLLWIAFFASACLSSLLAANASNSFFSLITLAQTLVYSIIALSIMNYEKKSDFIIMSIILTTLIMSITTIFFGSVGRGDRISMVEGFNPNPLANYMVVGMYAVLFYCYGRKKIFYIIGAAVACTMFYTIVLAATRKALIAALILLLLWFLVCVLPSWNFKRPLETISFISFIVLLMIMFSSFVMPWFHETVIFTRMDSLVTEGDDIREDLYREAIEMFRNNPIFGVGYDQFKYWSSHRYYSHSTYAETISCTGLIGAIIYFSSIIILFINNIRAISISKKLGDKLNNNRAKLNFCMLWTIMFISIGSITYYSINGLLPFVINIHINQYIIEQSKLLNNSTNLE